jgi:hypothetical protein
VSSLEEDEMEEETEKEVIRGDIIKGDILEQNLDTEKRNFLLDISNVNLDTIEGQNYIVLECQKALLTMKLTRKDVEAIKLVKDLVRTKKDLDTLKYYIELKDEIEKIKERLGKS